MRAVGDRGEEVAAKYLRKKGYKILARNYYSRFGEIDIIAQKDEYTIFIEVKMRSGDAFGGPIYAIGYQKQQKIKKTALLFLQEHHFDSIVRFDVVLIRCRGNTGNVTDIEVIEDAFR